MLMNKKAVFAMVLTLSLAVASEGRAEKPSEPAAGPSPAAPSVPRSMIKAVPVLRQRPPKMNLEPSAANHFERNDSALSLPHIFLNQWSLRRKIPRESFISRSYLRTKETQARALTLKQAIYIALRNNPAVMAIRLDPVAATESVRLANGIFDPDITSQVDVSKNVSPTVSVLQTGGASAFATKIYDWNIGFNKLLSTTNGALSLTFNNQRILTNSNFAAVNPSYNPSLTLSLTQPLLRNFGWRFATLTVQIAESGQKQAQWNMAQSLMDFVRRTGNEYWAVVLAQENLEVARAALRFNRDLVRQNRISVKVGTLAPLDLQEAQAAAATREANLYTAQATLRNAQVTLRQSVMYNPSRAFMPAEIVPIDRPRGTQVPLDGLQNELETAVQYRPSLGAMREAIRSTLLQVKFAENQLLPQLNLTTQFGISSTRGTTVCSAIFGGGSVANNCTPSGAPPGTPGNKLPFSGQYNDALNALFSFAFYNYTVAFSFEMPLDNASVKAALALARIEYEQARLQYRSALSQAVVDVQNAVNNLKADVQRVKATEAATAFARQSLHDEQVRFRVGMATTHDLLQFQQQLVAAQGNEVQAAVDLEKARLALLHADGKILDAYQIEFQLHDPHETPWYATF